jgi:predicted nucleic acid-binding protein
VALTAAKIEAELRDITQKELERRDSNKSETEEQRLERICENRRRKWDCFHIATAQKIGCTELYSTDEHLHKRPAQLGIKNLRVLAPGESVKGISGPLFEKVKDVTEIKKN